MQSTRPARSNTYVVLVWLALASCVVQPSALAQTAKDDQLEQLNQFSRSLQTLAARVSPSVVQVLVTRYGTRDENDQSGEVVSRQRNLGSGVIIDPNGFIVTNAHVVEGAHQIRVRLASKGRQTVPSVVAQSYASAQNATLVGVFREGDLALLKIEATALPALPFADYRKLRQGEVVFAFGSPAGLQNSMSMGVVSSIARQLDPTAPSFTFRLTLPSTLAIAAGRWSILPARSRV